VSASGRKHADELLALLVATGSTTEEAAGRAGVSSRTVRRRLEDPAFLADVARLRGQMTSQALGRLTDAMTAAADVLRDLLDADRESVRLGAARSVLELGAKLREGTELEQRLREVEARLEELAHEPAKSARPGVPAAGPATNGSPR
jgi:hypothetical protein